MTTRLDQWAAGFHRGRDYLPEVIGSETQIDLPASYPRYIEQIVEQPHHMRNLALDNVGCPFSFGLIRSALQHAAGVTNRREWIAQFVRQHGEKFVFAAIIFLQLAEEQRIVECTRGAFCEVVRELKFCFAERSARAARRHT